MNILNKVIVYYICYSDLAKSLQQRKGFPKNAAYRYKNQKIL